MVFVFKKDNFSISEVYWRGSFINRDLEKYIQIKYVMLIRVLFYIGLGSFLICIAFVIFTMFAEN
jgi:hypothetical protein